MAFQELHLQRVARAYRQQLAEVEANIPADLARAAWTEAAARDPKATLANAMFAWLRDQNITD